MSNRRAKLAAGATVLGLGALGGIALGTNHGIPAGQSQVAANGAASVVTSASGASVVPVSQSGTTYSPRPPIVTRASGGASRLAEFDD
jgi:hypothetical protein